MKKRAGPGGTTRVDRSSKAAVGIVSTKGKSSFQRKLESHFLAARFALGAVRENDKNVP
jgi:hypothetical protein